MAAQQMILPSPTRAQGNHGITMTLFSEFLQHAPQNHFEVRPGPGHPIFLHDQQKVNVCTRTIIDPEKPRYFPDSMEDVIKVESLSDLQDVTHRLLTNPIYFVVHMIISKSSDIIKGKYMVTVWPQHPDIQPQLQRLLEKAQIAMRGNNLFACELDFQFPLGRWFGELVTGRAVYDSAGNPKDLCAGSTWLTVTNASEYLKCYSCGGLDSICLWICCFPCCLLTCPCYRIQRCLTVSDYKERIRGETTVGYQCLDPMQPTSGLGDLLMCKMIEEAKDSYKVKYVAYTQPAVPGPTADTIQPSAPFLGQSYVPPPSAGPTINIHMPSAPSPYMPYGQPPPTSVDPYGIPPPPSYEEAVDLKTEKI